MLSARQPLGLPIRRAHMWWLWLNVPLMVAFFAATGTPA